MLFVWSMEYAVILEKSVTAGSTVLKSEILDSYCFYVKEFRFIHKIIFVDETI